jgi:hypothetical protein
MLSFFEIHKFEALLSNPNDETMANPSPPPQNLLTHTTTPPVAENRLAPPPPLQSPQLNQPIDADANADANADDMAIELTTPTTANNDNGQQPAQAEGRPSKKKKRKTTPSTPKEVINENVAQEVKAIREKEWNCILLDKYVQSKRSNGTAVYELMHQVFIKEGVVSRLSRWIVHYAINIVTN